MEEKIAYVSIIGINGGVQKQCDIAKKTPKQKKQTNKKQQKTTKKNKNKKNKKTNKKQKKQKKKKNLKVFMLRSKGQLKESIRKVMTSISQQFTIEIFRFFHS